MEAPIPIIEKPYKKFLEQGIIAVTVVDTVGPLLSRWLHFDYGWFSIISILIYIGVAYLIGRTQDLKTTIYSIIKLSLYDATVGFILSLLLGAYVSGFEKKIYQYGLMGWLIVIILGMGFSVILGLIGYKIARSRKKNQNQ